MTNPTAPLASCSPAFGRAGAYPPRYGWLLKVHHAIQTDPRAVRRADAPVVLGVGSSMVASMRFWALAFGLADRDPAGGGALTPTARGRWLLDDDGADPYLEDRTSLWLLHWWLLSARPCLVPAWYYVFGYARWYRATRADLRQRLIRAAEHTGWAAPADSTLTRDIACLVTMYAPSLNSQDQPRASLEDVVLNPFRELSLVSISAPEAGSRDRTQQLTVHRRAGRAAPDAVLSYACLSWATRTAGPEAGSISLSRLATDTGGPGNVLLADAQRLRQALLRTSERHPQLTLVESTGDEVLVAYTAPPAILADQVLAAAYRRTEGPDAHA
jgi:hypothetical protein